MANEVEIIVRTRDETNFKKIRERSRRESERAGDESSRGFLRSFQSNFANSSSKFFGNLAENATGIFSRAFGTSVSSNPYIGAGLSAVILESIAVLAPTAGVALGGGIVSGLGGGLAGLGLVFAAKNKEVQQKWDALTAHMSAKLIEASKPFVPVLLEGIGRVQRVFDQALGPALTKSFETLAPAVDKIFSALEVALRDKAVSQAIQDISDSFAVLAEALSPVIVSTVVNFATALSNLSKTVAANPQMFANLVAGVGDLAVAIVDLIAKLYSIAGWVAAHPDLLKAVTVTVGLCRGAIFLLIGAIKALRSAWSSVENLKSKLTVNPSQFLSGVASAISVGLSFAKRVFKASLSAIFGGVKEAFNAAMSMGRSWGAKVFTATFNVKRTITNVAKKLIPGFAHGGIVGAAANGGPRSNMIMTGEHGRELVQLPSGSRVKPSSNTEQTMRRSGSPGSLVLEIRSGGSKMDDLLVELIRKAVKTKGGDVQAVLGA
jgi:hypothetical protein